MKTIEDQALEYAEALNDIADILQLPTGVTSAEIVAACRESLSNPIHEEKQDGKIAELVAKWRDMSAEEMRLRAGDMTAQEIRSVKAVLNAILPNRRTVEE